MKTHTANPRTTAETVSVLIDGRRGKVYVARWADGWEVWVRWETGTRTRLTTRMSKEQAVMFLQGMKGLGAMIRGDDFLYVPPPTQV